MWRPLKRRPANPRWSVRQAYLVDQTISLFANDNVGGFTRQRIIALTGCESHRRDPLSIEFFNTIIRCNEVLKEQGVAIVQDSGAQIWRLKELA